MVSLSSPNALQIMRMCGAAFARQEPSSKSSQFTAEKQNESHLLDLWLPIKVLKSTARAPSTDTGFHF